MGVGIRGVVQGSIASRLGLRVGDRLCAVNGHPVRDLIDYRYLISEEWVRLKIKRDGREFELEVEKDPDQDLGLILEEFECRRCANRCIFCFVDQLPPGLRPSLYIKDDDYRLSFLQGTYITLTGLSRSDLDRIIEQRLSPLYVSVHTTEPGLRQMMLGNRRAGDILDRIAYLARGNIELHTQIVLCPGINDGPHLQRTVEDLSRLPPSALGGRGPGGVDQISAWPLPPSPGGAGPGG